MPELTYPRFRRRGLSSTDREKLYDRCRGENQFPICNIPGCGLPVDGRYQAWDESHIGAPHCFGGTEVGVAHRECNRRHGAEVVTPAYAKAGRVRRNFIGASISDYPMPGGRDDMIKRTMSGRAVKREKR